jgi:hypothetical protein
MSQHGQIFGRRPTEELNKVGDDLIELLGGSIPMESKYKASNEVQIQLTKAVALENNCGGITATQKLGRQANKTTASSPPVRHPNQMPLNQVGVQNLSLPRRLRRQLFTQSQSSPIRQPQGQVLPDLPAAAALEPAKKTRKRKALVEDHREVDIGRDRMGVPSKCTIVRAIGRTAYRLRATE